MVYYIKLENKNIRLIETTPTICVKIYYLLSITLIEIKKLEKFSHRL
jgi:hypothetical protein